MLSHPIAQDDVDDFAPEQWQIEHKFDGIRVQLVCNTTKEEPEKALFSRTGDDISHAFPDLLDSVSGNMVLDGELLVMHNQEVDTFNALQQRLNKKKPTAALMATNPAGLIVYDALVLDGKQLTDYPLTTRREALETWFDKNGIQEHDNDSRLHLSECLSADSPKGLRTLHKNVCKNRAVEGLMIKRLSSPYVPGRPKGQWYKWKRDPLVVDAVMMYAQRGHG